MYLWECDFSSAIEAYLNDIYPEDINVVEMKCAIPFPADKVTLMRDIFTPTFDRFRAAAPEGAKLHITDAFSSGNDQWAGVAHAVRDEIIQTLIDCLAVLSSQLEDLVLLGSSMNFALLLVKRARTQGVKNRARSTPSKALTARSMIRWTIRSCRPLQVW